MPATLFVLPAEPESVSLSRRKVEGLALSWGVCMTPDAMAAVKLITSELVTNAILHSGSRTVSVGFDVWGGVATVEVFDGSTAFPKRRRATVTDESGRGLAITTEYARRFGVEERPNGKRCWAEIALQPPSRMERRARVLARRLTALGRPVRRRLASMLAA